MIGYGYQNIKENGMKRKNLINWLLVGALAVSITACGGNNDADRKSNGEDNKTVSLVFNLNNTDNIVKANIKATKTMDRHGKKLAYHFDGKNNKDMIVIPHDKKFNMSDKITLSAWVKIAQNHSGVIVRKSAYATNANNADAHGCPYDLGISQTGDVILSLNLGQNGNYTWTQLRNSGYPINKWIHIAGTYDGTSMKLYIDGDLEAEQPASGTMSTNTEPLYIGTRGGYSTWNGDISDVRIYDKALSEEEIENLAKY
jgi:hypothetical protein